MENLLGQIQGLALAADQAERRGILDGLLDLHHALEEPQDAMQRLYYSTFHLPVTRIGCDLKLFKYLSESPAPLTVAELACRTGAAPFLLARICRYLASIRIIQETSADTYTSTRTSRALALEGWEAGIFHNHDLTSRIILELPGWLERNGYNDITDPRNTAFQAAFHTDETPFELMPKQPDLLTNFNKFIQTQWLGKLTWLDRYPFQEHVTAADPNQSMFVDIGGGIGHQAIAFREAVGKVPNRVIVQDQAHVIPFCIPSDGVEAVAQDFFKPQETTGAKIYYMRNVLHDWPDSEARTILENTRVAMAPNSVCLIDEMVMPERNAHWQATQSDILMGMGMAARERTQPQWEDLITSAGLKITNIYTYTLNMKDSIIECVPAAAGEGELAPLSMEGATETAAAEADKVENELPAS